MAGNPVSWFGIHAADLDRAKKFYETVFGETLQEVGGGGMRFMIFGADWAKDGVSGMLWSDGGAVPGYGGTTVFFNCTDCAETARAAVTAGGRLLQDKFPIANGYAAFVEDSEGNRIGLHSR